MLYISFFIGEKRVVISVWSVLSNRNGHLFGGTMTKDVWIDDQVPQSFLIWVTNNLQIGFILSSSPKFFSLYTRFLLSQHGWEKTPCGMCNRSRRSDRVRHYAHDMQWWHVWPGSTSDYPSIGPPILHGSSIWRRNGNRGRQFPSCLRCRGYIGRWEGIRRRWLCCPTRRLSAKARCHSFFNNIVSRFI